MVTLKPQDVLVALKAAVNPQTKWTLAQFSHALRISASEIHASVRRATLVGFFDHGGRARRVRRAPLIEFLVHGIRCVFIPELGGIVRGMPTAYATRPLVKHLRLAPGELPPVWPDPEGGVRGLSFEPLHRSAPYAALRDARLYECLALVDALRGGGLARERQLATDLLAKLLRA